MLNPQQISNLRDAARASVQCESSSKVPAEFTLSQWALESGWGLHSPKNNCFGVKYYPGAYGRQLLFTEEWFTPDQLAPWLAGMAGRTATLLDKGPTRNHYQVQDYFATFETLTDCFINRAGLLTRGFYANCLGTLMAGGPLTNYIENVSKAYATDQSYSNEIKSIMSMAEVQAALEEARSSG